MSCPAPSQPPFRAAVAIPPAPSSSTTLIPRAKPVARPRVEGRTERPLADPTTRRNPYLCGDLFDRACNLWTRDHGGTNRALARWLGIDESIVRGLRAGERQLSLARLSQMPEELQVLVLMLYRLEVLGHGA